MTTGVPPFADSDAGALVACEKRLRTALDAGEVLSARVQIAEATLNRVRQIADGWVGFDDSHHYGNAILLALVGEDAAPFGDFDVVPLTCDTSPGQVTP